ncbi:MAG: patatin-like phospholipase family protein [Chloroflexota bacterium]
MPGPEKLLKDKKIGLALGGGAARGMAHIGVIKVLEEKGIVPHFIAGTSIGSIIGAIYARELRADLLQEHAAEWSRWRIAQLLDPILPRIGLIKGKKVEAVLDSYLGRLTFDDLKVPFACVAVDVDTGEEVLFKEGLVANAVRASISIPGVFVPVEWQGRLLIDGGVVNPVPVSTVREMGANYVIAVNVLPRPAGRVLEPCNEADPRNLSIHAILMQTVNIASNIISRNALQGADLVIEPDVSHVSATDFHLAAEMIPPGRLAAEESLAAIGL